MSRASRLLSGHQLRRLLAYGGLLVPRQGIWHAYRGADTRTQSAGLASRHVVARLEAAGYLQPVTDFPDRRTASDSLPRQRTARAVRRPADISVPCSRKVGAALDHLLEAMPDRGTRIRLKAAAGRFRDDSGQAVRPLRLYQPARTAKDAAMRMQGFECTLGTDVMESLEDLIIDRCGFAALCVRWRETPPRRHCTRRHSFGHKTRTRSTHFVHRHGRRRE